MVKELKEIDISANKTDYLVSTIKSIAGILPWIGSSVAEVVGTVIPNQRMDRISEYLQILSDKVSRIEEEVVRSKFQDEHFVDLFEESLHKVARALTKERKEYIAAIVKNSITDNDVDYARHKYLLLLLSELNDVEILILQSYTRHNDEEFHSKHEDVLLKPLISDDWNIRVIHENYKEHMVRLGLLKQKFKKPKKNEPPELDEKTGMMKAQGYEVTSLGRILLRYADLANGL